MDNVDSRPRHLMKMDFTVDTNFFNHENIY